MRGLQRRDDAFRFAEEREAFQGFAIGDRDVLRASAVFVEGVLGADAGIIEAGRDRVRFYDLAVVVLEEVRHRTVKDAGAAAGECRGVVAAVHSLARRLDANEAHRLVGEERVEEPDRVRTAADAGDGVVWKAPFDLQHLCAGLVADDGLEVAHDHRVRVGADDGADEVVRVLDVGDPVADRFVDRVL